MNYIYAPSSELPHEVYVDDYIVAAFLSFEDAEAYIERSKNELRPTSTQDNVRDLPLA